VLEGDGTARRWPRVIGCSCVNKYFVFLSCFFLVYLASLNKFRPHWETTLLGRRRYLVSYRPSTKRSGLARSRDSILPSLAFQPYVVFDIKRAQTGKVVEYRVCVLLPKREYELIQGLVLNIVNHEHVED
jgi:hypothetical protein